MADRTIWTTASPTVGKGFARQVQAYGGNLSIATGDLALNKTTSLFKVPANFTVVAVQAYVTDMDSGTALVFSIGDATTSGRIVSLSSTAQAGGAPTVATSTILGYQYTAETEILLTCTTAAGTAVAGTLTLYILGYID